MPKSTVRRCTFCKQSFASASTYRKHRVPTEEGTGRRCLTPDEMHAIGMGLNTNDIWLDRARSMAIRIEPTNQH